MTEEKQDIFKQYINSVVKVIHRRGDMVFVNTGKLISVDEEFISIFNNRNNNVMIINKKQIDNLDIITKNDNN